MLLQKCCCCCDLRSGILYFASFLFAVQLLSATGHVILIFADDDADDPNKRKNIFTEDLIHNTYISNNVAQNLGFAIDIFVLVANGCLAYGAFKESRQYFLPFLIFIPVVLLAVFLTWLYILYAIIQGRINDYFIFLAITYTIIFCLYTYYWVAAWSLFKLWNPRNPENDPTNLTMPESSSYEIVYVENVSHLYPRLDCVRKHLKFNSMV